MWLVLMTLMYGRGPWGEEILREGQGVFLLALVPRVICLQLHELSLPETNCVSFYFIF